MALTRTLTVSTIAFERKKDELYGFRQRCIFVVSMEKNSEILGEFQHFPKYYSPPTDN